MEETKGPSWPKSTRRPKTIPDLRVCTLLEEQIRIGLCCPTWEPPHWGYMTTEIFHPSHTDPRFSYWKTLKYDGPRWVYEPPFSIWEFTKSEYTLHVSSGSLPCKARCALEDRTLSSETVGKGGHDWGDISLANWVFIARQIATLTPLCHQCSWSSVPGKSTSPRVTFFGSPAVILGARHDLVGDKWLNRSPGPCQPSSPVIYC